MDDVGAMRVKHALRLAAAAHASDWSLEPLGFEEQPEFWSQTVGTWLDNDANR